MARPRPARALAGWARRYPFAPRYTRAESLRLRTADGMELAGVRLVGPPEAEITAVLIHGFTNWSRHPRVHAFAHDLARRANVIVPDLRGHGRSSGRCSMGVAESLDVAAAFEAATAAGTSARKVVTIGVSMGGVATLLHAGRHDGIDATFALSAPAAWTGLTTTGAARVRRYVTTRSGRVVLATLARTRVAGVPPELDDAPEIVGRIAPALTVVVHDPEDKWFPPDHAERIYAWAGEPKELWWVTGEGHGVDMLTRGLADRILDRVALLPPRARDGGASEAREAHRRRPSPSP